MTTDQSPVSVRTFLLGDPSAGDDITRLGQAVEENGVAGAAIRAVGGLNRSARAEFARQLAAAVGPVLEIDLGDILVLGWTKHREVTAAAHRSLQGSGAPETVHLVSHQVTSTHHPRVDLLVDGTRLHTFGFEVIVTVDLGGAALTIGAGRLLDARVGRAAVTAELRLQDLPRPLVRQRRELELRPALRLGAGIPLARRPPPHRATG